MLKSKKEISDKPLKNKDIVYIDILRIIACFMVIINHTNGYVLENDNLANSTFFCLAFAVCKIGVPLFLMITGALILDKEYDYKKMLKCIFRVLVPVVGLSLLFYIKEVGIHQINLLEFLESILSKPYILPYWYIYALIGIYFTIPFIQKMIKNFKNNDYIGFLLIFLIFPTLINTLRVYFNIKINSYLQVSFFPIIISIVVCGNFISKIKLSKKHLISSIIVFIISYIPMFLSMYLPYLNSGTISYSLDSWNAFPVILMTTSIFYIIRHLLEDKNLSNNIKNIIKKIASTTFGIYLIHTILNHRLYKLGIVQNIFNFNAIIGIIILDCLVFIVCMIIIYVLKKLPITKRFL